MSQNDNVEWTLIDPHSEYRDQEADLSGPYWASVGPDAAESWSWTVFEPINHGTDNAEIGSGYKPTEAEAKAAAIAFVDSLEVKK